MRSVEDKEISSINFEFHKGSGPARAAASSNHHPRAALGKTKPTPSKWDDAQKWLVGLSRDKNSCNKPSKPRNSNADDTRLIAPDPVPHRENGYSSGDDEMVKGENDITPGSSLSYPYEVETKNVDCEESYWQSNKTVDTSSLEVRSVCVRDMGTEMTPIASQEPSRTATPIRATTPVRRSPIASGASTPMRPQQRPQTETTIVDSNVNVRGHSSPLAPTNADASNGTTGVVQGNDNSGDAELAKKTNPLETRAMAWDEAERAKYMARFKREEVKIQARENHEKRKAEMEMKKVEVKAERLKARAQEKYANKLAATRRIAEEKRANAEAELNEKAVKTSEKADYIRRTGHLPSTLFKLPSCCW